MKTCKKCKLQKELEAFRIGHGRCKECENLEGKRRRKEHRLSLLKDLGNLCVCCGETEYEFLQIDHKEGNGGKLRKELKGSNYNSLSPTQLRSHIDELQILCANCHASKSSWRECIHTRQVT